MPCTNLGNGVVVGSSGISSCQGLVGFHQSGSHVLQLLLSACLGRIGLLLLLLHGGDGLLVLLLSRSQLTLEQPHTVRLGMMLKDSFLQPVPRCSSTQEVTCQSDMPKCDVLKSVSLCCCQSVSISR